MTPKQLVARQLERPKDLRVIPDHIYMQNGRSLDLYSLCEGQCPVNADDVFSASMFYENAAYFGPDGAGRLRYYLNGVL